MLIYQGSDKKFILDRDQKLAESLSKGHER